MKVIRTVWSRVFFDEELRTTRTTVIDTDGIGHDYICAPEIAEASHALDQKTVEAVQEWYKNATQSEKQRAGLYDSPHPVKATRWEDPYWCTIPAPSEWRPDIGCIVHYVTFEDGTKHEVQNPICVARHTQTRPSRLTARHKLSERTDGQKIYSFKPSS